MSIIGSNILAGASGQAADAGFQIQRSLRFNSADDAHLTRTPSSAGNRKTWTWSGWVKRSGLGAQQRLFMSEISFSEIAALRFNSSDQLQSYLDDDGSGGYVANSTNAVFRDTSAWYHVVWAVDSTNATASNRVKLYVNGVDQSYTGSSIPQDGSYPINSTTAHSIGIRLYNNTDELDAYLADVHFIDGQALAASDFGEYDDNNVWQPIEYSGTYGTNGFKLDFSDNTSTTTIAEDSSGNNNDWTANNLSVASGAGNDSLIDTPTNYEADSGNNGGNYCTFNPLDLSANSTLSNGNLDWSDTSLGVCRGTIGVSSGKWYFEFKYNSKPSGGGVGFGIIEVNEVRAFPGWTSAPDGYLYYSEGASWTKKYNNGTATDYGNDYAAGDTISVALDLDAGTITFYKNGTSQGQAYSGISGTYTPVVASGTSSATSGVSLNTGQRPFAYTPPANHVSLCTQNLSESAYASVANGSDYFDIALDTGANILSSTKALCGSGADFLWIKDRANNTTNNILIDIVRDTGLDGTPFLSSNSTSSESALGTYSAPSGNSVGWAWEAGTSTASNTDGTITSSVRASPTAGFSIVSYTSNNTAGATIGHGLNAVMDFGIFKNRDRAQNWVVYHKSLDIASGEAINLNQTNKKYASQAQFNSTLATSSVFSIGSGGNASYDNGDDIIGFCWATVEGYSAFGKYTGNGSTDGPFVFTGMRPRWILIKESSHDGNNWNLWDTARDEINPLDEQLKASSNGNAVTNKFADYLSNGFKIRVSTAGINSSSKTYIYAAFAEHPFKTARAK